MRLNHNVVKIVLLLWNQIGAKHILRLRQRFECNVIRFPCATKTVHSSTGLPI